MKTLPNVGKVLSERLIEVGIHTAVELKAIGAENAFIRLFTIDEGACVNELMALEGAIQGIRWHALAKDRKEQLTAFHRLCRKQQADKAR